jgi:hypothetical protein
MDRRKAPRGGKEWGSGLVVHLFGAVGRQQPSHGGSERAALAHIAGAE